MEFTYRNLVERIAPTVLRSKWGRRLIGVIAFLHDELAEGFRHGVRAAWVGDADVGPAYDALSPAGHELSLPRYPNETWPQYHARLQRAWDDWPFAGDEAPIIAQLAAAGWPGAQIYDPRQWSGTAPTPYWSQFWVYFAFGTHPVTGIPVIGSFTVGDGTVIGATGITIAELYTIRAIISKWKPGHWICRAILFQISGWTIGDGHVVGEPDLTIGGVHAEVAAA